MTRSTPIGSAASSTSQRPDLAERARRPLVSAQPTQPPVARIRRVSRLGDDVSDDCCIRPAAASTSTAMPASGTQPRAQARPQER